jgi:transcriptional regulator with XRE-family HTH domain
VRAGEAWRILGARMRELRQAMEVTLGEAAQASGWGKSHLSRVERGLSKPSRSLVGWYDVAFCAGATLLHQLADLEEAVRADREVSRSDRRNSRRRGAYLEPCAAAWSFVNGGSVPADYDARDSSVLVAETIPDGTIMCAGEKFAKTWTVRNAGPLPWRQRWLTRQGRPGVPGWLRSPLRVEVGDAAPGADVVITVKMTCPVGAGSSAAYFKITDGQGRPYFPTAEPLHCMVTVLVASETAGTAG